MNAQIFLTATLMICSSVLAAPTYPSSPKPPTKAPTKPLNDPSTVYHRFFICTHDGYVGKVEKQIGGYVVITIGNDRCRPPKRKPGQPARNKNKII